MLTKNKKGQVGETMTWIVATLIIIVVLTISIYVSSVLGEAKSIIPQTDSFGRDNLIEKALTKKSMFSFLLTKGPGDEIIYDELIKNRELSEFSKELGKKVFREQIEESGRSILERIKLDKETEVELKFDK